MTARPKEPNQASFLKDVSAHVLTVMRDDGVNRHLRFQQAGSWNMAFDLITWPGHLCYTGDMGTFVFSRVNDMLEFFRSNGGRDGINPSYWSEKILASDRNGGFEEFDADSFCATIKRRLDEYAEDHVVTEDLRDAVDDGVLRYAEDGEYPAMRAAMDFEHDGFHFHDIGEANCREYTYRFIWCCYALVWGIQQYDASKVQAAA